MTATNAGKLPPIIQVGDVLLSPDVFTECFCCDLAACGGACCVEGDAGAPVTTEEIGLLEDSLDGVWGEMSASAQAEVERNGVASIDPEGELVTAIVCGRDCVFATHKGPLCLCLLERAYAKGRVPLRKPISCALYPLRERSLGNGLTGLNYHRWDVCRPAVEHGRELGIRLYEFLREPLVRRFGEEWYAELLEVANELRQQNIIG